MNEGASDKSTRTEHDTLGPDRGSGRNAIGAPKPKDRGRTFASVKA